MKFLVMENDKVYYVNIAQLFVEVVKLIGQEECENLARGYAWRVDFSGGYVWRIR